MSSHEQVDLACRGFRNAVQCWCRRYARLPKDDSTSLPQDIEHLLKHVSHLIYQLTTRRQSLQRGLVVLQKYVWPLVLERFRHHASNNKDRAELLNHFLSQCLRLHDGVVLLVSGECRHAGDIRAAKKTKFPSRLHKQNMRSDGYTILYQAPGGYSGFGFDEYNDETVGIVKRLLETLAKYSKKKKSENQIQDYLTEHGGQALEALLDQHDTQMTAIHEDFKALREKVVNDLKKAIMKDTSFASKSMKVSFNLHDKMEKLQVGNIVLERRADAFQVLDSNGVLPKGYTIKDWEGAMKIPDSTTKAKEKNSNGQANKQLPNNDKQAPKDSKVGRKRRRVIEESDSEDDDKSDPAKPQKEAKTKIKRVTKPQPETKQQQQQQQQQTPVKGASTGLSIKIKAEPKPQTPGEGKSYSLASIKAQMGADPTSLETAREELEREEAGAAKAAKKEEMEDEDMTTTYEEGVRSVHRARSTLKRVRSRDRPDEDEIWDARETLRKALMAVGNQFLWPSSEDNNQLASDRQESLDKAYKYFEEAKEVVAAQEMFHRSLFSQHKSSCTPEDSRFLLRNLLLLRGQAHTNMGIARTEMATRSKKKTNYNTVDSKRYLREAIQELTTAKDCAQALRSRALLDKQKGSSFEETAIDSLRADKLDSLASRWVANTLWRQGRCKEASEISMYGSSFFLNYFEAWGKNPSGNQSFQEAQLELGSECYYSCSSLVDLASASMDELPLTGAVQRGDELLAYVKETSRKVSQVSKAIQEFIESNSSEEVTWEEFVEDNDIMTSDGIEQYCKDITDWWNRRKAIAQRPIPVDPILPEKRTAPTSRNDIVPEGPEKMPTRRFVVTDGTPRRRKKWKGRPNSMYNQQSGNLPSSFLDSSNSFINFASDESNETRPIKYRPWGDELLPQTVDETTGRTIPIIPYPAVAPPMPPEVRALLFLDSN